MAPGEDAEHGAAGGEPGRRLVSLEKLLHLSGTSSLREVGIQVLRASVTTISMNKGGKPLEIDNNRHSPLAEFLHGVRYLCLVLFFFNLGYFASLLNSN